VFHLKPNINRWWGVVDCQKFVEKKNIKWPPSTSVVHPNEYMLYTPFGMLVVFFLLLSRRFVRELFIYTYMCVCVVYLNKTPHTGLRTAH
jgi:hypothetical protein